MYKKLSDDAKVDVLTWLGDNKVESQFGLIASELAAPGARGAAAAEAIAMLGGEKAADALLAVPVTKDNVAALKKALSFVNVDLTDKVVKALPEAESLQRDFLVELAGDKRIYEAAPFILKLAENDVPVALKALAGVVAPADFPALAKMMDKNPGAELEKAMKAALKTLPAAEKYTAVKTAADAAAKPELLYNVMATAANPEAIAYLTEKYEAGSETALKALSTINDLAVAPVLLKAADADQNYLSRYVSIVNANEKNVDKKCENLVKALQKADDAIESGDVSAADIADLVAALDAAVAGLLELGNFDEVDAIITSVESYKEKDYTPESWAALAEALEAIENAKKPASKGNISTADVADLKAALEAAVAGLVGYADFTELDALIASAEALVEADYTAESWAALQSALKAANDLKAKVGATAPEAQAAHDTLKAAIGSLVSAATEPGESDILVDKKEGCGGVIGATAVVITAVLGLGAVALKKREN